MGTLLDVRQLRVRFHTSRGEVTAVDNVSFSLEPGETLALVGETGSGKSVTVRTILRLPGDNASIRGTIHYKDRNLLTLSEKELSAIRGQSIAIILQNPDLALNPVLPVGRQLIEPLTYHCRLDRKKALERAKEMLAQVGFEDVENLMQKYPFQLSGGMKQRILIATAMLTAPEIIIADEPTRALDRELAERVRQELAAAQREKGSALLWVTHDLESVRNMSDRVAVIYAGELVEINTGSSFFQEPRHPYSRALLASLPGRGFHPLPGMHPPMISPPSGCRFHPRCQFKTPHCAAIKPRMVQLDQGEVRCLLYS